MSDNVGLPTLDLLCDELSQVVEWDRVAVSLKVPFVDIKDIETRYSGLEQRKMHSLQKWLEQTSTVHSWRTVADAVQKVNPFVAEQIRKKYAAILDQESSPFQHDKRPGISNYAYCLSINFPDKSHNLIDINGHTITARYIGNVITALLLIFS